MGNKNQISQFGLSNFAIPAAIDVLSTGNYSRLPTCMVEKVINKADQEEYRKNERRGKEEENQDQKPEPPIKNLPTNEITDLIKHKLITSNIPRPMTKLKIMPGGVQFYVSKEFALLLTIDFPVPEVHQQLLKTKNLVYQDYAKFMKWKVVDLVILTKNESLPDKKLLHPNQIGFLKGLLQ